MMNTSSARPSDYFKAVPAVVRAFAVLRHLADQADGCTLAELSRALDVNPSSLLAIVNTLAARGYLRREPDNGRYRLGYELMTLAASIAVPVDLRAGFDAVARGLTDRIGETSLLWTLDGVDVVLISSLESLQTLRLVPRLGTRRRAESVPAGRALLAALDDPLVAGLGDWITSIRQDGLATGSDPADPTLAYVAAPILGPDGRALASIGLGGPSARLQNGEHSDLINRAVRDAAAELSARLGCTDYQPYRQLGFALPSVGPRPIIGWSNAAGALSAEELDSFLASGRLARIACVKPDGYPYTIPAWYEWDGTRFWVMPRARAEWAVFLRLNPRVSMAIDEPDPPLRRVLVEGHAEVVEEPCLGGRWHEIMIRMAPRYLGAEAERYLQAALAQPHWLFRVEPEQVRTWRGLTSHPRYERQAGEGVA